MDSKLVIHLISMILCTLVIAIFILHGRNPEYFIPILGSLLAASVNFKAHSIDEVDSKTIFDYSGLTPSILVVVSTILALCAKYG